MTKNRMQKMMMCVIPVLGLTMNQAQTYAAETRESETLAVDAEATATDHFAAETETSDFMDSANAIQSEAAGESEPVYEEAEIADTSSFFWDYDADGTEEEVTIKFYDNGDEARSYNEITIYDTAPKQELTIGMEGTYDITAARKINEYGDHYLALSMQVGDYYDHEKVVDYVVYYRGGELQSCEAYEYKGYAENDLFAFQGCKGKAIEKTGNSIIVREKDDERQYPRFLVEKVDTDLNVLLYLNSLEEAYSEKNAGHITREPHLIVGNPMAGYERDAAIGYLAIAASEDGELLIQTQEYVREIDGGLYHFAVDFIFGSINPQNDSESDVEDEVSYFRLLEIMKSFEVK